VPTSPHFGLQTQFTVGRILGQATLEISVNAGDYTPGDYEIRVLSKVGELGHRYGQIFYISVQIL
jgi:hypothetical protein